MPKASANQSFLYSIPELIDNLTTINNWKLSLAQRSFEWSKLRITNLADSILRGIPIGSILLVKSTKSYYDLAHNKKLRRRITNKSNIINAQIIDGQQRCIAILSTFGCDGLLNDETGDMEYLWINACCYNDKYREFDEKKGQKYLFHWSNESDLNKLNQNALKAEKMPTKTPSRGWIKLEKLYNAVREGKDSDELAMRELIGDSFDNETTKNLFSSLKRICNEKRIPIHILQDDEAVDLFHTFIRINTGGLPLSQVDAFFAGVKKHWPDAEEHLARIVNKKSIFRRQDAITLLARCAGGSLEEKYFDPVRLKLQHLVHNSSRNDYPLINKMKELTPIRGMTEFISAVEWSSKLVRRVFYRAADLIPAYSIMNVVAWAYTYSLAKKLPSIDEVKFIKPILGFLFWTTILRSRWYGRTRYDRETFKLSWGAGNAGLHFPYETKDMINVCYYYYYVIERLPNIYNPANLYLSDKDEDSEESRNTNKILDLVNYKKEILLSIFQEIEHSPTDLDHLIAYNYARRSFKKGRKYLWNYINWVNTLGNFACIDSSANRMLQDKKPSYKLKNNNKDNGLSYMNKDFIKVNHNLSKSDIDMCMQIETLLANKDIDKAGRMLEHFVADRTIRIWRHIINIVGNPPDPKLFNN